MSPIEISLFTFRTSHELKDPNPAGDLTRGVAETTTGSHSGRGDLALMHTTRDSLARRESFCSCNILSMAAAAVVAFYASFKEERGGEGGDGENTKAYFLR